MKNQLLTNTKIVVAVTALGFLCALPTSPAHAAGDAERGALLAYTCLGCHGIDGYRNAYPSYRVPKLGGQKAAYLAAALRGYRNGTRDHATMKAQASSLSDQDIEDLAAYISAFAAPGIEANGVKDKGIEAAATCVACHGESGISLSPTWPTLAGQHEDYLVHALDQYRDGSRNDPVMSQMATPLSDADVKLLARYYARLQGLATTEVE